MKPGFNPDHAKPNHPTPIKTSDLSGQGSETKVLIFNGKNQIDNGKKY